MQDEDLRTIQRFLEDLKRPDGMADGDFERLVRKASKFFVQERRFDKHTMSSVTRAFSQHGFVYSRGFGGSVWNRTSDGSSRPVMNARLDLHSGFSSLRQSQFPSHSSENAYVDISSYPEWRMLLHENARAIGTFIFEDILCRWGAIEEIVTDNGPSNFAL